MTAAFLCVRNLSNKKKKFLCSTARSSGIILCNILIIKIRFRRHSKLHFSHDSVDGERIDLQS